MLEITKNFEIPKQRNLEIKNEKDIFNFFKKCEMNNFEIRDHFNLKAVINEGFQNIKKILNKNYDSTDIEELFDDIIEIILEILESDGKILETEIVFKILNFETKFVDFLSFCKT